MREGKHELISRVPDVSFVLGDAMATDISDADFVFANSTCFDKPVRRMRVILRLARAGSYRPRTCS